MVASVDLDDLPAAKAKKVRAALADVDFTPKRRRAAPARIPDGFQYDIEVDDGKRRTITVHDPISSREMQTLLDVLLPLAEPE